MGWVASGARVLAATALIPTVWFWTAAAAQAATSKGLTVPDVVFAQGSGEHAVGITIASTSVLVKSADTIEVYASSPYIVAVSGTAVGATCTGSSGTWTCHASAWEAGAIRVTVSTTAADCDASGVCKSPLEARVEGSAGWLVQGSVEITPKPTLSPSPSAARSVPPTATPVVSSSSSIRASSGSAGPSTSAEPGAVLAPAPSGSVAQSSAAASGVPLGSGAAADPGGPAVAQAVGAHAASSSGTEAVPVLLACAGLLLLGGFVAWGMTAAGRRRRAAVAIRPEAAPPAAPWSAFESRPKPQAAPPAPEPMPEPEAPAERE